jgi:hypothetical protein
LLLLLHHLLLVGQLLCDSIARGIQMGRSLYLYGFNVLKSVNIGRTSNNLVEALGPPLLHSSGDSLQVETELIVGLCQLMS